MIKISDILGSDIEYKDEVIQQSEKAIKYLAAFDWCNKIHNGWLSYGFGYILCIFYFEIEPKKDSQADDKIWIIVGDIPSVYLDTVGYPNAHEALSFYCYLMEEWISHVNNNISIENCYPINVPPTKEYANMLQTRISLIKEDYLPNVK